jgi:hypothetical protein
MQWLFVPLADEDVLLPGERVLYSERRHWAAVSPELWELCAVLFLRLALAIREARGLETLLVTGVVASALVLMPLLKRDRWSNWALAAVGLVAVYVVTADVSVGLVADLVVAVMVVRFAVRAIRWGFYQRLYVTDRRVLETDGFLGVTVNSMPLKGVTDTRLRRTPLGELLGYGTFHVESAGQEQTLGHIDFIFDAEDFHDCIVSSWAGSG